MHRLLFVVGTRPEAIKLAPIIHDASADPRFVSLLVTTGQHTDMVDQVLNAFALTPAERLTIDRSAAPDLAGLTAVLLQELSASIHRLRPDAVVVQGDTTSAYAGALGAFYLDIPVVHVEAGLRTGNMRSPFPEEMNRRGISMLAALHLAPTAPSRDNLLIEGTNPNDIVVTGNSVIDALHRMTQRASPWTNPALSRLDNHRGPIILVTTHRRESWGEPMANIGAALAQIAVERPDALLVFPAHLNPLVRDIVLPRVSHLSNVVVTDPLGYADFCQVLARSTFAITDSGGVQEEAPSLGKPVLVMRDTTERPEAIDAGSARLVGTDTDTIVRAARELLTDADVYNRMAGAGSPYGDGRASARTLQAIAHVLGGGIRSDEFDPATALARA